MNQLPSLLPIFVDHLSAEDLCNLAQTNRAWRDAISEYVKLKISTHFPWTSSDNWFSTLSELKTEPRARLEESQSVDQLRTNQISHAFQRQPMPGSAPVAPIRSTWYSYDEGEDGMLVLVQHTVGLRKWRFTIELSKLNMREKDVYGLEFSCHGDELHAHIRQEDRILLFKHNCSGLDRIADFTTILLLPKPTSRYDSIIRIYRGQVFYIERQFVGLIEKLDLEAINQGYLNLLETSFHRVDVEKREMHFLCTSKMPEEVFTMHTTSFRNPGVPIMLSNKILYLCDSDRGFVLMFDIILQSVRLFLLPRNRTYSTNVQVKGDRQLHFISHGNTVILDLKEDTVYEERTEANWEL